MNKLFFTLSRIGVGILFIFSGFVKAVDPVGSAIKFSDYLGAFHMEGLLFLVMPLAFSIATLEFLTGIHLLFGFRIKTFSILALLFMAIFTPLTLGIAISNPVSDCGCFGDAIKLTNWQTFFKNIIISIPVVYLFIKRKSYTTQISPLKQFILSLGFLGGILGLSQYGVSHLPVLDFRPYKVGVNIPEGMSIPEGAEQPEYETTFIMEKDGKQKVFGTKDYPYNDSTWVFVDSETKVITTGYQPPIHDFVLLDDDGNNMVPEITSYQEPTLLIVSAQINKGVWGENLDKLKEIQKTFYEKGMKSYLLTSSSNEEITSFEFNTNAGFNYLIGDETMLKTVVRSNPGLVLVQNGNIIGKWHYNDIPDSKAFDNPVSYSVKALVDKKDKLIISLCVLAVSLFAALLMLQKKEA